MTGRFEVAIVGGGVIGLSVARELARLGVAPIAVFERNADVGQESSSRANGGFRAQFTTVPNIEFSRFSIGEYERLRETYGPELSMHQTGYLLMAGTEEGERSLRQAVELQRSLGVATEWLAPSEVSERAPFVRTDGLRAGTLHQRDGIIDPHGVVTALRREVRALGVEIRRSQEVLALEAAAPGGLHVRTAAETTASAWVVNAAGAHATLVASMLGVEVPVFPVRRNLAYVHDPAGGRELIPMCVDLDTGVLVRRDPSGGFVVAYSDPDDPPGWDTSLDPAFLPALAQRVGHRFPFLAAAPVDPKQCWAGLYPETPDHHAIIGASDDQPRFLQCVGFGGHGIMHAPAAGRAIAELVALGRCDTFDLHPLRPSRFAEGDLVVEQAVL